MNQNKLIQIVPNLNTFSFNQNNEEEASNPSESIQDSYSGFDELENEFSQSKPKHIIL